MVDFNRTNSKMRTLKQQTKQNQQKKKNKPFLTCVDALHDDAVFEHSLPLLALVEAHDAC